MTFVALLTGLAFGFIAGKKSERKHFAWKSDIWKMLVDAGKANEPISGFTMCTETGASFGWFYPYLARLERDNKVIRVREPQPDGRPARYLYMAVISDAAKK